MIVVIAKFKVKSGMREQFLKNSKECICLSRLEEGNCGYDALLDPDDPDGVVYIEQWADQEAADRHGQSAHYLANKPVSEALRVGVPDVKVYITA